VKGEDQIKFTVEVLKESQKRLKAAIKAAETTSYFSGGKRASSAPEAEGEVEAEGEGKG
jgi:hypothetical protein